MPHEVDLLVGKNIRSHRKRLGVSQGELGEALDVSFQQIQKYEKGTNRCGASRLYQIAEFLGLQIQELFEGALETAPKPMTESEKERALDTVALIKNERMRESVYNFLKEISYVQS